MKMVNNLDILLRVYSNSVEVVGHDGNRKVISGKKNVEIINIESVGNYAIKILFNDFHDTGIYSYQYLYELGINKFRNIKEYLINLKKNGLSRETKKSNSTS